MRKAAAGGVTVVLAFAIAGPGLRAAGPVVPAGPQKTITNERLGFRVSVPADWTVERRVISDDTPDDVEEYLKKGGKLAGMSDLTSQGEHDWNGVTFNQGTNDPAERPIITVFAIERKPRTFDQFSRDVKATLLLSGAKILSAQARTLPSGIEGYDFTYEVYGMTTRFIAIFQHGKRYSLKFVELSPPAPEKAAKAFDAVLASFQVLPSTPPSQLGASQPPGTPAPKQRKVWTEEDLGQPGGRVSAVASREGSSAKESGGQPSVEDKYSPEEEVARDFLAAIYFLQGDCRKQFNRLCPLEELLQGVPWSLNKTIRALARDPREDPNYEYQMTIRGGSYEVSAIPRRPGLGGFLLDYAGGFYYNPKGGATNQDKTVESRLDTLIRYK